MGTKFREKDVEDSKNEKFAIKIKGMKMNDRHCTDILCCLVFVIFLFSCFAITGLSVSQGNPGKIMTPFDSDGNQCGQPAQSMTQVNSENVTRDFTEYPYKYFTNIASEAVQKILSAGAGSLTDDAYYAVCVKECPNADQTAILTTDLQNEYTSVYPLGQKIKASYPSNSFMGYCVPDLKKSAELVNNISASLNKNSGIGNYVVEIKNSWKAMTLMVFGAFLITIIYLALLKWITKPLLYISLFAIFLFGALGGAFLFLQKDDYPPESESYYYMISGAVVVWVLTFIYMVVICCQWSNIALGASVMEAAGTFVSSNPRIAILPITTYIAFGPIIVWWLFTTVYLYSIGEATFEKNEFTATIQRPAHIDYLLWYILFGLFWFCALCIAIQKFITNATTCMWFFSGQGSDNSDDATGQVSIMLAVNWAIFKHIGSLAMGSFLIAVVTMIKVVFEYMAAQQEKVAGKDNVAFKCIACCIRCAIWCLDAYVKFINENAYIQIALHNSTFCKGAWESFYLMVRHGGRFGSAAIVSFLMVWIGKGCITALSVWLTILLVQQMHKDVTFPLLPAVFVGLFAYVVSTLFLNIFSSSALAILHSFILTEDQEGPKDHIPESLKAFLDKEDFKDHQNEHEPGLKKEDKDENAME